LPERTEAKLQDTMRMEIVHVLVQLVMLKFSHTPLVIVCELSDRTALQDSRNYFQPSDTK